MGKRSDLEKMTFACDILSKVEVKDNVKALSCIWAETCDCLTNVYNENTDNFEDHSCILTFLVWPMQHLKIVSRFAH